MAGENPITLAEDARDNAFAEMLAGLLGQNIEQKPEKAEILRRMRGVVSIAAGDAGVRAFLAFDGRGCTIGSGGPAEPKLSIRADSEKILGLATLKFLGPVPAPFEQATVQLLKDVLASRIKIEGMLRHPLMLLRLARLFSVT
ncbi:MAG: hypothetical protein D6806_12065 [Deltaproteobacteria bacterium]|nr:MAG: hypothetical protein D6806_12065 [Deltaproteobacteria bacterium]